MTAVDAKSASPASASPADAGWFRPDIDGLRAVAIVLVVAYHAGITGFDGGFIGVDVFFVISGWLITRNILRESERTGTVAIGAFWARRIRRLVPGLALVIVATMVGSALILSRAEVDQVADQGIAATFYVSNIFFADQSQGYFATDVSESPFLHTWSLGVEEQFYVFWPVLVGLAVFAVRRRGTALRTVLGAVFGVLLVVSFVVSQSLTDDRSTWAFYGLPSRVWEFAVAGLLATVGVPAALTRYGARVLAGVGGLGLLAAATVLHDSSTPYPGTAALLPVIGTLALIVAGDVGGSSARLTPIGRTLGTGPFQWVGRVSYSWYLWHWPVLILSIVAFDRDDVWVRTAAVAASLPVAWLAYRFVENPIRATWAFIRPTGRSFLLGAGLTGAAALIVVGCAQIVSSQPAAPLDAQIEQARAADTLLPDCDLRDTPEGITYCAAPGLEGDQLILVIGDSKAVGWFDPLAEAAAENGVRLAGVFGTGCPVMDVDVLLGGFLGGQGAIDLCRAKHVDTDSVIASLEPDVVLISQGSLYLDIGEVLLDGEKVAEDVQVELWAASLEARIDELRRDGSEVAIILDNPAYGDDPNVCVARAGAVEDCELSRDESLALIAPLRERELEIVERLDVGHFDATEAVCGEDRCDLGTRDYLHYFDSNHLSARSMTAMIPAVSDMLRDALARTP